MEYCGWSIYHRMYHGIMAYPQLIWKTRQTRGTLQVLVGWNWTTSDNDIHSKVISQQDSINSDSQNYTNVGFPKPHIFVIKQWQLSTRPAGESEALSTVTDETDEACRVTKGGDKDRLQSCKKLKVTRILTKSREKMDENGRNPNTYFHERIGVWQTRISWIRVQPAKLVMARERGVVDRQKRRDHGQISPLLKSILDNNLGEFRHRKWLLTARMVEHVESFESSC